MAKILYVEDNEMGRDMLQQRLKRKGFDLVRALDGEEAVQLAHSEQPDLILMDMSLPVKEGWTAAQEIKDSPETKNIPIIALTAHVMSDDRVRAIASSGCDDFDTKPIELPRLLEKINRLLAKS
ncbi:MAG: response regulator [Candidatus Parabeggiatoa sp. nov. 3]|jgi:CheY-like chemotaxis protein|nr:MAG: response regulator [Gammaproteobacteria bacterium]RKZ66723.1 MAG: response regulator [Gammaproteobacteria bacterium]RKZ86039.1 MAG: response regulator [Gammaproteobacteria bacterium]